MFDRDTRLRLLALIGDISSQSEDARTRVSQAPGLIAALTNMVASPNELQSTRESALVGLVSVSHACEFHLHIIDEAAWFLFFCMVLSLGEIPGSMRSLTASIRGISLLTRGLTDMDAL